MDIYGSRSNQQQRPPKQKKRRKRSAEEELGEDICTEIFRHLPVKSILKFKTLSKGWHSIFSSRSFCQFHASTPHTVTPVGLFFPVYNFNVYGRLSLDCPNVFYTKPLLELPDDDYLSMPLTCTSSCNGLLLFRTPNRNSSNHIYHIYNPTTQESKPLLDIPPHITKNKFVCASLAFDPCESLNYKIIFLCRHELSYTNRIKVYSSATGVCKAPESNLVVGGFAYDDIHGIFCNDAIHWLSKDGTLIFYFNVHTNCIKEVSTSYLTSAHTILYFGESQGRLRLVNSYHGYISRSFDVYELTEDYSGWFRKYQVKFGSILSFSSLLPHQLFPCKINGSFTNIFQREEDDDLNIVLLLRDKDWVEYNFKTKTTKMLCEHKLDNLRESFTSPFSVYYGFDTHQFIPTLTCL